MSDNNSGGGFDPMGRQPRNRSGFTDAVGFFAALAVVYGVVMQTDTIADPAARGFAILTAGVAVTLLISELVLRDSRRWLFVVGMLGLFAAAAAWFILPQ